MNAKPKTARPPVTSWSYSRYADYRECPAKFHFKHVQKVPEPQGPALARGNEIHDALELFVLKKRSKLAEAIRTPMGVLYDQLSAVRRHAMPEMQAAFDREWRIVPWDDWDRAWCRVMVDLTWLEDGGRTVQLRDYKSGKVNEAKHAEQLELYAVYGFVKYPEAQQVIALPWYVDHGLAGAPITFDGRRELTRLQRKWEKSVGPLFADRQFKAKPGAQCKWCPFSGRKGGPCKKG